MSGIFGLITKNGHNICFSEAEIEGMHVWNRPYGRECESIVEINGSFVGCCIERLDKSMTITSPVMQGEGKTAVIDAVIYNRDELIQTCKAGSEVSDEELLYTYINKFGIEAVKDVNGDFAGAIYDPGKKELLLFRDHMGIRPLYYFDTEDYIAFSTDVRGITGILRANIVLDDKWMYDHLSGHATLGTEITGYRDVFCVMPASYIDFSLDGVSRNPVKKQYWRLRRKKIRLRSDKEYQAKMRELIADAIKRRLDAISGTVGAELSGGLDSGVIDILIHRFGRECFYYSWSPSPEDVPLAANDERLIIDDICKQEKISCVFDKSEFKSESLLTENIGRTGIGIDPEEDISFRYAFPGFINVVNICNVALFMNRNGVHTVFTGHGGDEGVSHRMGAYEIYYNHEYYYYLRYMWSMTHGESNRVLKTLKAIRKDLAEGRERLRTVYAGPVNARDLINPELAEKYAGKNSSTFYFGTDSVKYIEGGATRNRLDNVALMGAWCGVRYLVPFLDYRVVDYAVSIPRYQYVRGYRNRYIYREAFKDILPDSLYSLKLKSESSVENYEQDPEWREKYIEYKRKICSRLDKDKFGKFIDFDALKRYADNMDFTKEEADYSMKEACLYMCLMSQNAIDKSREASRKLMEKEDLTLH